MNYKPSRILNEQTTFIGLSVLDLAGLGYLLIITHSILSKTNLELLSFAIVGFLFFILVGIRTKYRSKIIRDYFNFKLTKRIFKKSGMFI